MGRRLRFDICQLLDVLDMTIAADIQATIIVQFDSVDRLAWVGSGFLLGSVCSIFPV